MAKIRISALRENHRRTSAGRRFFAGIAKAPELARKPPQVNESSTKPWSDFFVAADRAGRWDAGARSHRPDPPAGRRCQVPSSRRSMDCCIISPIMKMKATIFVLTSGALWGCISLFVRRLDAAGLLAMDIACVRMLTGAIGMLAIVLSTDRRLLRIRLRDIWLFVGTGIISVTLFNLCYFTCMMISEASIAVVLLYTSPVFVMLMSAVFFKEKVTKCKILAIVCTFTGCILVSGVLGGSVQLTPFSLMIGISAGFFYATYSIFGRVALNRYDPLTITFYTFAFAAAAGIAFGDVGAAMTAAAADPVLIVWYIGLGIVCTILPYLLYTQGLRRLDPGMAAVFATVEPLVGSMLGIFVYGESVSPAKLAGMALILAAVLLVSFEPAPSD